MRGIDLNIILNCLLRLDRRELSDVAEGCGGPWLNTGYSNTTYFKQGISASDFVHRHCNLMKRWTCTRCLGFVPGHILKLSRTINSQQRALSASLVVKTGNPTRHQTDPSETSSATKDKDGFCEAQISQYSRAQGLIPLPPFMDPSVTAARSRTRQPKSHPSLKNRTPFQKKLYNNPYAHILAQPIRQCNSTSVRLPSFFFLSLHAKIRPETDNAWLLPVDLFRESSVPHTRALGPPARCIGRKVLIQHIMKKLERGRKDKILPALGNRLETKFESVWRGQKWVWREDLPDLAEKLLGDIVWRRLRPVLLNKSDRLVRAAKDVSPRDWHKVSCVVYLDRLFPVPDYLNERLNHLIDQADNDITSKLKLLASSSRTRLIADGKLDPNSVFPYPPIPQLRALVRYSSLEFPSLKINGRQIAVYSLIDMLGTEKAGKLLDSTQWKGSDGGLAIMAAEETKNVQLCMMRLQGYLSKQGA